MDATIADVLKFLKREAESRALGQFLDRVPRPYNEPIPNLNRERATDYIVLYYVKFILINMTVQEKRQHFDGLLDFNHQVLARYFTNARILAMYELKIIFRDLLHVFNRTSYGSVIKLIKTFKTALRVDYDFVMNLVEKDEYEYILYCVSNERFGEWIIRRSTLLMKEMNRNKLRSIVLLKYGFPYMFERHYYDNLCFRIYTAGLRVNGRFYPKRIFFDTRYTLNLRLQMALELLLALFNPREGMNQIILSMVWKTIPHPFISSSEMLKLMSPFFQHYPLLLQEICDEYVKCNTVFDVPEVPEPRSLMHLARVAVRRRLVEAHSIGDRPIDSLRIPRSHKSYLKLES